MGFFDKIKENIFGHHEAPNAAPAQTAAIQSSVAAGVEAAANSVRSASASNAAPQPSSPQVATTATPTAAPTSPTPTPTQSVDVTSILDKAVAARGQKLEWRHSIVDLLKAIDVDSSLAARKELAAELHYTGNTDDTATMNVWLHKAVIKKLAENGGKVPADLLD